MLCLGILYIHSYILQFDNICFYVIKIGVIVFYGNGEYIIIHFFKLVRGLTNDI